MPKSNVHPDHYKIAGRERQGEDVIQELEKQALSQAQSHYADPLHPRNRKQEISPKKARSTRELSSRQPIGGSLDRNRSSGTRRTRKAGKRAPRKRTR